MTLVRMLVRQAGQYEVGAVRNVTEAEAQELIADDAATLVTRAPAAAVDELRPASRRSVRRGGEDAATASVTPPAERRG